MEDSVSGTGKAGLEPEVEEQNSGSSAMGVILARVRLRSGSVWSWYAAEEVEEGYLFGISLKLPCMAEGMMIE